MAKEVQKSLAESKGNVVFYLSPKERDGFDSLAARLGLSRSELAAKIGEGVIPLGRQAKEIAAVGKLQAI